VKIEYPKSENDEAYKRYIEFMEEKILRQIAISTSIPEKYLRAGTDEKTIKQD